MFPTIVFDGFYEDPDRVVNHALQYSYFHKPEANYPGERSPRIDEIDQKYVSRKIAQIIPDGHLLNPEEWTIQSNFQKTYPYSDDENDPLNLGWPHTDWSIATLTAVIYLTKNPYIHGGTSIFELKESVEDDSELIFDYRNQLYNGLLNNSEKRAYRKAIKNHRNQFVETVSVKNVYNRIVIFDSRQWHSEASYYNPKNPYRFTQVCFCTIPAIMKHGWP